MRASVAALWVVASLTGPSLAHAQLGINPYHAGPQDSRGPYEKALSGTDVDQYGRRLESNKKAKKAPAADRAPSVTVESQQRAAEPAPAQATPPDSTHTKVKPTTSF